MRVTPRTIREALGLLWLLDGALQLQPFMFGRGFAEQIIAPTAEGQPQFVAVGVHWASSLILTHPAIYDTVFAVVQIALGIGLLVPRTVRMALAGSIGWGLGVWYFGEGLNGIASGQALMLTGAPGAALLYGVLAAALWPTTARRGEHTTDQATGVAPWLPFAWALLWIGAAAFNAMPGQNSAYAISQTVDGNADGAPGWLATIDHQVAHGVHDIGVGIVVALVTAQIIIGIAALAPGWARTAAVWTGTALSLAFWVVGQSVGKLYSGQATDPSTAVIVVLLGAAVLALNGERVHLRIGSRQRATARSFSTVPMHFLDHPSSMLSDFFARHCAHRPLRLLSAKLPQELLARHRLPTR